MTIRQYEDVAGSCPNPLNVFKGPDSMAKFFDPDQQPPLPLVELPAKLNPFKYDNVRIYAKMLTALPAQNVKSLPALNMLLQDPSVAKKTIIEQSSGSTALSLAMIARVLYNNEDCRPYVSNKVGLNRIRQLRFFGCNVELYGGPSQPGLSDPRGTVHKAHKLGQKDAGFVNPGQYDNENNWKAHIKWTGPQLWKQLPEINVFCMAMGSAGCITGTGLYLKSQKPSVKVVGVCFPVGDIVPGPRTLPLVEQCEFPWKQTVDSTELVNSEDAHRLSMQLSREGLICGPSSGLNLQGLFNFLQKAKAAGELQKYSDPLTGEISCVFVCCDLPYQHIDGYFERLPDTDFPPIRNEELLDVDKDEYAAKWELSTHDAISLLQGSRLPGSHAIPFCTKAHSDLVRECFDSIQKPKIRVVDLRSSPDFKDKHLSSAINSPLSTLTAKTPSPFDSVETLQAQWAEIKAKSQDVHFAHIAMPGSGPCLFICYDGETSRLATAILRAQGVEAYSLRGGMSVLF